VKRCPKCELRFGDERTFCFIDGTSLEVLADPRIGSSIAGRYTLESVIGEGGMATVYRAKHKVVEQPFAVKLMNPLLARDPIVRERFRREAKSAKKISHPNIIEIFEEGDTGDGTAYMVMEFLDGESLADLIARGPIAVPRVVGLAIQMARGIARAHDLDVIHRDLKPENIFVCRREDGTDLVKLLDFGIALSKQDSRLTGTGELFGTPQYMAPERISTMDAGASADLYALGVIFFEMLTGRLPFDAPDVATFFVRHLKDPPLPIRKHCEGVPEGLADLIDRLLLKDPKQRPADAHKVAADLVDVAKQIGAPVPVEPQADPASLRGNTIPVSEGGGARWGRRVAVFQDMLAQAYGATVPPQQSALLSQIEAQVAKLLAVRERSVQEQNKLEEIARRGREGRTRLGYAVDALGADTSRAREELRVAQEEIAFEKRQCEAARKRFLEAHKEITRWEGRSGFVEPYEDLANAYRDAADVVEGWRVARDKLTVAERSIEGLEQAVRDLEFQITKLRESLQQHEQDIEAEREACEALASQLTGEVDSTEEQLLHLGATLCEPLRRRPELAQLFSRLEAA
jgi:serine/threonine-protein kinase